MVIARPLGQHWTFGHQAVQPVATVAPAATSSWPIIPLALLCLALALLAIASTIVLSLIPIYTRSRSAVPLVVSRPFSNTFFTANGTLATGPLTDADRAALQAALNAYIARDGRFPGCTVNLSSANVQNCPSTRRILQKRGRRRRRQQQQQQQRQSSPKRIARQTAGSCVDQQILTTSTLTCASCVGVCLLRRLALLQSILPNFLALVPFPSVPQPIQISGPGIPLSPTTTTVVTAAPGGGSNTASTAAGGGGSNTASTAAGGGGGGGGGSNTVSTPSSGGSNTVSTSSSGGSNTVSTSSSGGSNTVSTPSSSGSNTVSTSSSSGSNTASTSPSNSGTGSTTSTTTAFPGTSAMPAG